MKRQTIAQAVTLAGRAVRRHGDPVHLTFTPGDQGRRFVCGGALVTADLDQVVAEANCTALDLPGGPPLLYVEHVLSALAGLALTDVDVHLDDREVPLFDGSALPLVEALLTAGRQELPGEVEPLRLRQTVRYERRGQWLELAPADEWSIDYTFAHAHPRLAHDQVQLDARTDYATAVAPARTFATVAEIEQLQRLGLLRGGDESMLLLVRDEVEPVLRLPHEYARHKVLDLIGDFALLGRPLLARITACRTGHSDNHAAARLVRQASG
ncbi:MAG: UDP-3-O-acyl-N-acetylglucosamine deacetylase [Fimbriimonadaceae bacterium]|nr:UDP-3-O-acyl-N-acetylglucosamine deacetylase [Fimbriimonadaceae bacterium]